MKLLQRILFGFVVAIVVGSAAVVLFSSFSTLLRVAPNSAGALTAMENDGYTNVVVEEGNPLLAGTYCAEGDTVYFKVTSAINKNGVTVTNAYVCAGTTIGYVIRYHSPFSILFLSPL